MRPQAWGYTFAPQGRPKARIAPPLLGAAQRPNWPMRPQAWGYTNERRRARSRRLSVAHRASGPTRADARDAQGTAFRTCDAHSVREPRHPARPANPDRSEEPAGQARRGRTWRLLLRAEHTVRRGIARARLRGHAARGARALRRDAHPASHAHGAEGCRRWRELACRRGLRRRRAAPSRALRRQGGRAPVRVDLPSGRG